MGELENIGYCEEHDTRWSTNKGDINECFVCVFKERDQLRKEAEKKVGLIKVPSKVNKEDVIAILESVLEGFKTGDTLEFNLQVTINYDGVDFDDPNSRMSDTPWDVMGMMRYGQEMGQGFVRMFNSFEEEVKDGD